MCSGHKPFCLHCKGTTFVDANHTVAYVAVRILNFNCCSAATVHPRHKAVDCYVWVGCREIEESQLLLGVWSDFEIVHVVLFIIDVT